VLVETEFKSSKPDTVSLVHFMFYTCLTDARQNNDYSAGYSIGSLQGKKTE
jgi:hypothetical protein